MNQRHRSVKESGADRVRTRAAALLAKWVTQRRHVEDLVEEFERDAARDKVEWTYAERRRLREIVFGVARLRGRYEFLVSRHAKRDVEPTVAAVLWVALHELVELDEKQHAAVDQANRVVIALGRPQARGFVNGVLRSLLRERIETVVPDAATDPLRHAVDWLSMPEWLVQRWMTALGPEEMLALCRAQNRRPSLVLRAAPGRRENLRQALAAFEWEAEPLLAAPDALELVTRVPPALLLDQLDEPCVVQDAAAQLVAPIVALGRPTKILDLCAAPGGKATHVAQLLPAARIVAADVSEDRLSRVRENVRRLGLGDRFEFAVGDARTLALPSGSFDAVLLDAPCTGTGVLSRRQDARWNRRPEDLQTLPDLQRELLTHAFELVRPGGVVVYATCSLEPEENDQVVDSLLSSRQDVAEIGVGEDLPLSLREGGRLRTWPHRDGLDGAFAARLRKAGGEEVA